jgi:manganese-dependent inorganic pyrophosphatase
MATIYVTGHRNPDTDSVASAIGYAELKQRLNPRDHYIPVRLGEPNAQTRWALERAGAETPELLPHIMLRACDVMRPEVQTANHNDSLRDVGVAMARDDADMIPIVDDDGVLVGMLTARDLARRYVKETGEPSSFADRPVSVDLIVEVLGGELLVRPQRRLDGRLWAVTVGVENMGRTMAEHDIVVLGDRADAQMQAVRRGIGLLVSTYGTRPSDEVLEAAAAAGTGVVVSPLDSYVTGRLVSLSVPVKEVMSRDPLTTDPDDLVSDITDRIKDVHYSAAVAVDDDGRPVGVVTRADLVNPEPRHVLLVDHAEQAQSVVGVGQAHIVEILDHHHIGSIETKFPVAATFDPVGSTATLVVERFRAAGREPRRPTAMMLLSAILSDTVILSSPTTTERDHQVVAYLEELLELDARAFGIEMFEASSDVGDVPAHDIVRRDAKDYEMPSGRSIRIAQIETVGHALAHRRDELLDVMEDVRREQQLALFALMVTDIVGKGTELLVSGDASPVERAFGVPMQDGAVDLPGVMSRKKQVAPKLLSAMS